MDSVTVIRLIAGTCFVLVLAFLFMRRRNKVG